MTTISATYSPEDNKIRLYVSTRLDAETYEKVKAVGFKWAPKQELFVAPKWTPAREDLAIELAGDIEPEEMTLAERATIKAERLDALAIRKNADANAFARRADEIAERFAGGQPILIGHHSERKARKDKERMNGAQDKASKAASAANYWLYRATGVEAFANMKNCTSTRANRIKTLLAELRDLQRGINEAHAALKLWDAIKCAELIRQALGRYPPSVTLAGYGTYSAVDKGEMTALEARDKCIAAAELRINGAGRRRWIDHVLNRLAFERSMLGEVPRYGDELTPVIIQAFAREHGTEKPKAIATDPGFFQLESDVPLPVHIADSTYLELSADEWRDLMQSSGYVVPEKKERRVSSKPAPAALINPTLDQSEQLQRIWNMRMVAQCKANGRATLAESNTVKSLTQATYSNNSGGSYSPLETVQIDAVGRIIPTHSSSFCGADDREPAVARIRIYTRGTGFYMPRAVVHISDKPAKALPLDLDAIESATHIEIENAGEPATLGGLPYIPALLVIKRYRQSTSQGSVILTYNGRVIDKHADMIQCTESGTYEGQSDDYWHTIARRVLSESEVMEQAA